jgi:hypothetical protein
VCGWFANTSSRISSIQPGVDSARASSRVK